MNSVVDLFNQIASNDFGFFQRVQTVKDVMTSDPYCLTLDDSFESAEGAFRRGKFRHAPVRNPEDGTIVGIVSDRDLLRHRPRFLGKAAEGDSDQQALRARVTRFMTRNPIWCTTRCSPVQALTLMLNEHIDCVLVSDDGTSLDGIVTPTNFIHTLLLYHRVCTREDELKRLRLVDLDLRNGLPLDEIFARGAQSVRDVMTKSVVTIAPDDSVSTAIEFMQEHECRHLPVVQADGRHCGMLSDRDLLSILPTPKQRSEEEETRFREILFAADDRETLQTRVERVMSRELHSITPGMLLTDAMAHFDHRRAAGLPVLDPDTKQLVGILTTSDILRVFRVVMQLGRLNELSESEEGRSCLNMTSASGAQQSASKVPDPAAVEAP